MDPFSWGAACLAVSGTELHRLLQRIGHIAVSCCDQLVLVWGGYNCSDGSSTSGQQLRHVARSEHYHDPRQLLVYQPTADSWWLVKTGGVAPPPLCGATGACLGGALYVFGGTAEPWQPALTSGALFCLNLSSLQWQRVTAARGPAPLPSDKLVSWTYQNRFYVYGGYGPPPPPSHSPLSDPSIDYSHVHFCRDDSPNNHGYVWLDQLAYYDPGCNRWRWPAVGGGPSAGPRAAHAAARLGATVYVYGGRCGARRGDFVCLQLDTAPLQWRPLPGARASSWHSLTPLGGDALLLYGGLSGPGHVLSEPLLFCLRGQRWLPFRGLYSSVYIPVPQGGDCAEFTPDTGTLTSWRPAAQLPGRMWHAAVAVASATAAACGSASEPVVLLLGGLSNSVFERRKHFCCDCLAISAAPPSLQRLCVDRLNSCPHPQLRQQLLLLMPSLPETIRDLFIDLPPPETAGVVSGADTAPL